VPSVTAVALPMTVASPTPSATSTEDEGEPAGGRVSEASAAHLPSAMMLGSTGGILVAFVISVVFLLRERRMLKNERADDELDYWTGYR
jgi:hypothetical protein